MERLEIAVSGRVQGVFFRTGAKAEAERLGLTGFTENRPDGSVFVVAEGSHASLEAFLAWCRSGPPLARVTDIAVAWRQGSGEFTNFRVI